MNQAEWIVGCHAWGDVQPLDYLHTYQNTELMVSGSGDHQADGFFYNENVKPEYTKIRGFQPFWASHSNLCCFWDKTTGLFSPALFGAYQWLSYLAVREAIMCQVHSKNCSYLASNNVNSFSLRAYRFTQVNSSISPSSPTSLRAADAIIFLAPTSHSPHPPSFWAH